MLRFSGMVPRCLSCPVVFFLIGLSVAFLLMN